MGALEVYWAGVLQRLRAEVDVFARLVNHMGERGRMNELALASLLEGFVPESTGVGTGLLIDSTDYQGPQTDVILFDQASQPAVMAQTTQVLFPVEVVQAAIEVKTSLTTGAIDDCIEKHRRLKKLQPVEGFEDGPPFVVLAYNAAASPKRIAEKFREKPELAPDLLCVLDLGLIGIRRDLADPEQDAWMVGLAVAEEKDETEDWSAVEANPSEERMQFEGHFAAVIDHNDRLLVADAGRALLLFADALARIVARRSGGKPPAFSHYLTQRSRSLELL